MCLVPCCTFMTRHQGGLTFAPRFGSTMMYGVSSNKVSCLDKNHVHLSLPDEASRGSPGRAVQKFNEAHAAPKLNRRHPDTIVNQDVVDQHGLATSYLHLAMLTSSPQHRCWTVTSTANEFRFACMALAWPDGDPHARTSTELSTNGHRDRNPAGRFAQAKPAEHRPRSTCARHKDEFELESRTTRLDDRVGTHHGLGHARNVGHEA